MGIEIGPAQTVAIVRTVSSDQRVFYLEYRNGSTATVTSTEPTTFRQGSVVFIGADNAIELAPNELWREEIWIGVVRYFADDKVIVNVGGRLKKLSRPVELELEVDYTVEGDEDRGITGIVAKRPINYLDLARDESVDVSSFRTRVSATESNDPNNFDEFGGFAAIIHRAKELVEVPLVYRKELAHIGARPIKGVLFAGPPGTGKTMLARIIAKEAHATFYEVSGPELTSKWYGQSEELVRAIFEDAAKEERAIIFFDEIDSLASQRNDTSHEASRRIVGQLLSRIDGFDPTTNILIIATTNRAQDIDVALRRPGRLDWQLDFTLPDIGDREAVLRTSSNRLTVTGPLSHAKVASMTEGWSSAELSVIWSEAALLAVVDGRQEISDEDYLGGYERVSEQRRKIQASAHQEEVKRDA